MKRSRIDIGRMRKEQGKASLGTLIKYGAVVAGGAFVLKGCSSDEARIYANLNECEDDNPTEQAQCNIAYQDALREWRNEAPRYPRLSDCEYDFGDGSCRPLSQHFIPIMTGFMLLNNGSDTELDLDFDRPRGLTSSKRRYSPAYNRWSTADGALLGNTYQRKADISKSQLQPTKGSARVMGRGGFGRTVSSRSSSSWGG
ncbi:DUF1190 domain-containing protein [Marinobacterium weihaiense]|uniref:DUF1190 domain-containing protein n=1 Tax=Marinobacterium weihaiense TaxID=2851016 RepID=A0ABS6M8D9_9GAMM|nr:DUF1190 domain-containing protein [Marinobacterium weihaiense]MBV0932445.1 DUF1190 domain-containing protein [Marinobacterium weihaiense]